MKVSPSTLFMLSLVSALSPLAARASDMSTNGMVFDPNSPQMLEAQQAVDFWVAKELQTMKSDLESQGIIVEEPMAMEEATA